MAVHLNLVSKRDIPLPAKSRHSGPIKIISLAHIGGVGKTMLTASQAVLAQQDCATGEREAYKVRSGREPVPA